MSAHRKTVLAILFGAVIGSAGDAAAADEHKPRKEPNLGVSQRGLSSDRAVKIRKAQSEIEKNPSQRKFILFRYGLKEEDLR